MFEGLIAACRRKYREHLAGRPALTRLCCRTWTRPTTWRVGSSETHTMQKTLSRRRVCALCVFSAAIRKGTPAHGCFVSCGTPRIRFLRKNAPVSWRRNLTRQFTLASVCSLTPRRRCYSQLRIAYFKKHLKV